jgi:flagellar biosynthesis anti-sigma factor FlgM
MRIDNGRQDCATGVTTRTAKVRAEDATGVEKPAAAAGSDTVTLSSDAQLLAGAVKAAMQAPEVREDVVARAKALVERGEIGRDPGRLADALIDGLLSED